MIVRSLVENDDGFEEMIASSKKPVRFSTLRRISVITLRSARRPHSSEMRCRVGMRCVWHGLNASAEDEVEGLGRSILRAMHRLPPRLRAGDETAMTESAL